MTTLPGSKLIQDAALELPQVKEYVRERYATGVIHGAVIVGAGALAIKLVPKYSALALGGIALGVFTYSQLKGKIS